MYHYRTTRLTAALHTAMVSAVLTAARLPKRPDPDAEDWPGRGGHLSSRLDMVVRPSVCLGSPSGARAAGSHSNLTATCPCRLQPRSGRFQLAGRAETLLLQQKGHGQRPGALIAGFVPAQEVQAPVHFEAPRVPKTFGERHVFVELPPPPGKLADSSAFHAVACVCVFAYPQSFDASAAAFRQAFMQLCTCFLHLCRAVLLHACLRTPLPRAAPLQGVQLHTQTAAPTWPPQNFHVLCQGHVLHSWRQVPDDGLASLPQGPSHRRAASCRQRSNWRDAPRRTAGHSPRGPCSAAQHRHAGALRRAQRAHL